MTPSLSETPLDRVRAVLLSHAGQIVSTSDLLHVAFGPDLPQGALMHLRSIISDLIHEEEPIERTPSGYRLVLACESAEEWASSDFIRPLREFGGAVQGELFGGVA